MPAMKPILSLAAVLALAAQRTTAQQPTGYGLSGVGTSPDGSLSYNATVAWLEPSRTTSKGGVNLVESKDGKVVYRVVTDKLTLPKMVSVAADLQVPVWGYVKSCAVKYSSLGSCGPTLTAEKTAIVVTVTPESVMVECPSKSYSRTADAKAANPFKLQRVK